MAPQYAQLAKIIVDRIMSDANGDNVGPAWVTRYSPCLRDDLHDARAWVEQVIAEELEKRCRVLE